MTVVDLKEKTMLNPAIAPLVVMLRTQHTSELCYQLHSDFSEQSLKLS